MALLGRAQIEAADDRKWEDVYVPEWDGEVRLMELSAADRGYIDAGSVVSRGEGVAAKIDSIKTYRDRVVACGMVDENFQRLYSNKDIAKIGERSGKVIERLADKVLELSAMGRHAKDTEGNSEAAPSGSSDSD